ncbi:MAG: SAM-dependent methyltransferase [candidate division Zixibacteria bacterium]|nr:SAM-dependent methyltransferase [candidate division Zixibacteria bacterium]
MTKRKINETVSGSFRDPSGFLFYRDDNLYRQINKSYKDNYNHLINSGLYEYLVNNRLLIPHIECNLDNIDYQIAYKIIKPEHLSYISYPYEWCFSQLKDAALITLNIQKKALEYNMSLKDCSAYNIQFQKGRPIFIDTLSFDKYKDGQLWSAYRQFCQHFLAPLALMSYTDVRLNQLFRIYIDGPPLDLTSSLLPLRTRLKFSLLAHLHLHAKSQKRYAGKTRNVSSRKMNRRAFLGLIDSLERAIGKLKWKPRDTEWIDYYNETNYSDETQKIKITLIEEFLNQSKPEVLWDLGSNTGFYSRLAASRGVETLSFDIDPACVERNYLESAEKKELNILPLILDLTNPSPGIGWQNRERHSFIERGPADTIMALALIHHLAISNNLPLAKIADFFSRTCGFLIIEFIPKSDSQVQRLLSTREDIFPQYSQRDFELEFQEYFEITNSEKIGDSERILYLMKRLNSN